MRSLVFSVKQLQSSFELFFLRLAAGREHHWTVCSCHSSSRDMLSNGFRSMNHPTTRCHSLGLEAGAWQFCVG